MALDIPSASMVCVHTYHTSWAYQVAGCMRGTDEEHIQYHTANYL